MTTSNQNTELDKAIESALHDIAPFKEGDGYYGRASVKAGVVAFLIESAKRLKEVEKENEAFKTRIQELEDIIGNIASNVTEIYRTI